MGSLAALTLVAWACGSKGSSEPTSGVEGVECESVTELSVSAIKALPQAGWYQATASGEGATFTLRVELNDDSNTPLAPGRFDLTASQDASYASCQHCVLLLDGSDDPEAATQVYYPYTGAVVLDAVSSPVSASSKGSLAAVRFRPVSVESGSSVTTAQGKGKCYSLQAAAWDTNPPAGAACVRAEDCGDPSVAACDPSTGACVVRQCTADGQTACPSGSTCLAQSMDAAYGACYRSCTPFGAGCDAGFECLPLDAESTEGKCVRTGPAGPGDDCDATPTQTGCAAGLVCVRDGDGGLDTYSGNPVCRPRCDFFGASTCADGTRCSYGGYCTPTVDDDSPVDGACSPATDIGTPCGPEATGYRGLCVPEPALKDRLICRRACRSSLDQPGDCPDGQICDVPDGEEAVAAVCRPVINEESQP
jgi:hypothetical protein